MYVFIDYLPSFHFGDFECVKFFQCASRINKHAGKTEYQKHCVWNHTNNMERHKKARYMWNSWQERRYHSFLWRGDFREKDMSDWVSERLIEWLIDWLIEWEIDCVSDCLIDWFICWVSVWVCEFVSVWVCVCLSIWVWECVSEGARGRKQDMTEERLRRNRDTEKSLYTC